jgi:DNA polymerase phi
MTCLVNQAAKEDRYLHRAAIKTLKAVEGLVASNPDVLGPILQNLLSKNGVYNFDQRTNTKTVDKLLQSINANNETEALNIIRMPLAGLKKKEASDGQATLRTFIDYLSKCLNGLANSEGKTVMTTSGTTFGLVLQELGQLAYSQPNNIPSSLLTSQIREFCRTRLESSLARLARQGSEIGVFCTAVASIDSNAVTMDAEIRTSMEKASSRMHKLLKRKSKSDAERSLYHGLAMLHAVSIFQLFNEDPDAMEVLQDLSEFSEKLKMGSLSADGAGSSELLVEILLAMVTRPSSLMRQISHRVFEAFTGHISVEALGLLTGPLATGESTKGQKELFNTEDDAMDVDGEDESDEDEDDDVEDPDVDVDSDVEFVKLNGDDAEEDSDGGNDDDEGEEEEDEEGEEEDETTDGKGIAELDTLLGSILNSHRLDKDVEAESSESENDMSDSEMLARDEKLAAALKPHIRGPSNAKKQKKDAKQSVVNFKHRILDLLGIYVKNEALNPIAFSVLTPLLQLMRITSTKALANRACEVILDYQKGLKKARGNKEETGVAAANELLPLLVEVHEEAGKDNAHAYTKAASAASLIIVSAIFAAERDALKLVASVYTTTQLKWALGEAKSQTSFFVDWINWCQNLASQAHL